MNNFRGGLFIYIRIKIRLWLLNHSLKIYESELKNTEWIVFGFLLVSSSSGLDS